MADWLPPGAGVRSQAQAGQAGQLCQPGDGLVGHALARALQADVAQRAQQRHLSQVPVL